MNWLRCFLLSCIFITPVFASADVPKLTPTDATKRVEEGKAVLVDVREPKEWAETGVAAPAVLLPKSDYDGAQKQWKEFLANVGSKQVILYCRSGHRAGVIGTALAGKGVNVANAGGMKDWIAAGLPLRKYDASPAANPAKP